MTNDLNEFLANIKDATDLEKIGFMEGPAMDHPTFLFGHSVELYCANGSTVEQRLALVDLAVDYEQILNGKITHFHPLDSARLKKTAGFDWAGYFRKFAMEMGPEGPGSFNTTLYGFEGGKDEDAPTPYYFSALGSDKYELYSTAQAYLPAGWPQRHGGNEALIALMQRWCSKIGTAHGTAGFSIILEEGQPKSRDSRLAYPFLQRFPGLDYPDPVAWKVAVRREDRRHIRSINWLTAIDNRFVEELGGLTTIKNGLGSDCPLHPYNGGIIIQAGPQPQLGDVNRGLIPEQYQLVAKLLKPLRFEHFRPKSPYFYVNQPLISGEENLKWLQRFD